MKSCPKCNTVQPDELEYCDRCQAELPFSPPSSGRMVGAFFVSLPLIGLLGAPTLYLIAAGVPEELCALAGIASWIFGLILCGLILAGSRWTRREVLPIAIGLYLGAHLVMGLPGYCVVTACALPIRNRGHASCPHVYSFDGERHVLDADPLSGAFLAGAERDDLVRLDHARPVDGRYRLEIRDEMHEKDALDLLELVLVDHDPAVEILPTPEGRVLGVTAPQPPRSARDRGGADRLDAVLRADDDAFVAMSLSPGADPIDATTLELTFDRPAAPGELALVLRAHATKFAEDALTRYLSGMGSGLGGLMTAAERDCSVPFRDRIHDEIARLGLPLHVEVDDGRGYRPVTALGPVGPAIQRTQAVPLGGVGGAGPLRVRLRWTPRFWTIDAATLAASVAVEATHVVKPSAATGPAGSALRALAAVDGERVHLDEGQRLTVELPDPARPGPGRERATLLRLRGYYEMDLGDGHWLHIGSLAAHNSGLDSLPAFAARLANQRPDLAQSYVW